MKEKQQQYKTYMSFLFWTNIIFASIVLVALLYIKGTDRNTVSNITFERYAIILTLAGIPLALKMHHIIVQKIKNEEIGVYIHKYFRISVIRLLIMDAIIVMNMLGFYLYEAPNFIYMCLITIFALIFTYPNKNLWETQGKGELTED